jgi:hypothetical protein
MVVFAVLLVLLFFFARTEDQKIEQKLLESVKTIYAKPRLENVHSGVYVVKSDSDTIVAFLVHEDGEWRIHKAGLGEKLNIIP